MGHLHRGVELVGRLADPVQRRDRELALLLALGPVSMMVTGAGTPEIGGLYTRALQLCEEVPKSGQHFAARLGTGGGPPWIIAPVWSAPTIS